MLYWLRVNTRITRQPPQPPASAPTSLPILMSAVYPGIGQFIQQRWVAGAIYSGLCTVAVIYWFVEFLRIMLVYLSLMDFDAPPQSAPSFKPMLAGVGIILVVYAASLADTIMAHARATRRFQSARETKRVGQ